MGGSSLSFSCGAIDFHAAMRVLEGYCGWNDEANSVTIGNGFAWEMMLSTLVDKRD